MVQAPETSSCSVSGTLRTSSRASNVASASSILVGSVRTTLANSVVAFGIVLLSLTSTSALRAWATSTAPDPIAVRR